MSRFKVANGLGQFVDPCNIPIKIQDNNGNWKQLKQGDRYRANGVWNYISCGITAQILITKTPARVPKDITAFTVIYYFNGDQTTVDIPNIAYAPPLQVDINIQVLVTWDPTLFYLRVNGVLQSGGSYIFVPSVNITINAREI